MSRQINPGIFGESSVPLGGVSPLDPLPLFDSAFQGPSGEEILQKVEKTRFEIEEAFKSMNLRLEKTTQKGQQIDERLSYVIREVNDRISYMMSRLKERTMGEMKIEALVERHNQIVQSFELRINQSQKVIENQALQLAKQQELIDDARRQIEKLKRL